MAISTVKKVKQVHEGKAVSTVKSGEGAETQTEEKITSQLLSTATPIIVGVSAGFTKNMGNYSSARAEVTLQMPVSSIEEVDDAYDFAKGWIDAKLTAINDQLTN